VLDPVEHMKRHGNYREFTGARKEVHEMVDSRHSALRTKMQCLNRLLAAKRRVDSLDEATEAFLQEQVKLAGAFLKKMDAKLESKMKKIAKTDRLVKAAMGVPGLGAVTIAYCWLYLDAEGKYPEDYPVEAKRGQPKAPHASSFWKYVGLHTASHERHQKGVAGGGNKKLRTQLYITAGVQIRMNGEPDKNGKARTRSPYLDIYERRKADRAKCTKMTMTRVAKKKGEKETLVKKRWCDVKPSHRHGDAVRVMIKHILADWWYVARDIAGLPTGECWVCKDTGTQHRTIRPQERGWVW